MKGSDCVLVASCGPLAPLAGELKPRFRVSGAGAGSDGSLAKNVGLLLSELLLLPTSGLEKAYITGFLETALNRSFTSKVSTPTPEPLIMLTKFLQTRPVMITGVLRSINLE